MNCEIVSATVEYSKPFTLKHVHNFKQTQMFFKTEKAYLYYYVNYLKENILIKLPDLRKAQLYIKLFDKNNLIHQLIVSVNDFIQIALKLTYSKSRIFIYVQYGNEIKFIGTFYTLEDLKPHP